MKKTAAAATVKAASGSNVSAPVGAWVVLVLATLGNLAVRLRLLSMPLERDEGEYALAGMRILQGHPPYDHLYNMKWPGTYYAYALIEAAFGQNVEGIRLGLLLVNLASILLVFAIGRKLLGAWPGAGAALAYAVLSVAPRTLGFAGHANHFVVLAALLGLWFLLEAIERKSLWMLFLAGVFSGAAPIMKQPGIVFPIFAGCYWLLDEWRTGNATRATLARRGTAIFIGMSLPFLVMLCSVTFTGTLETFWLWTISYARHYGNELTFSQAISLFVSQFVYTVFYGEGFSFWIVAGFGVVTIALCERTRAAAPFTLGLLVFSFLGVLPGFKFREHYFLLMLPAVALLVGSTLCVVIARIRPPRLGTFIAALTIAGPLALTLWTCREFLFRLSPNDATELRYGVGQNTLASSVGVGDYLRDHTGAEERIAVIGSEPQIYFYARREPATGFIYTYALMEPQPFARMFQEQMAREIEAARPKYVVFVNSPYSWLARPTSDRTLQTWFDGYRRDNLVAVGAAEIDGDNALHYRWNEAGLFPVPNRELMMTVFRRIERK